MTLLFVTSNAHKFTEAREILRSYKIRLKHLSLAYEETRAHDTKDVAVKSAKVLFEKIKKPLICEDSGLFIQALNGFPGTYSAWVYKKIGNDGILRLLAKHKNRKAYFKSSVAYTDSKTQKVFCGEVHGIISKCERGKGSFGYDPIFIPISLSNLQRQTFAENEMLKNTISHRFNAFIKLAKWYQLHHTDPKT
ncbi:MAG: XTP/dITP diphosphatase [Candidatus Micrarchaeota archaeon]